MCEKRWDLTNVKTPSEEHGKVTGHATAAVTDEPIARVYGEPVGKIPADLYIPPDALAIYLDAFEGPLDLLLYLIRKVNINILDIPMALLTRQYLDYVERMRRHHLDLAAEYLLMSAMLLEIKSRLLLPRPAGRQDEEGGDPRAELVRRLIAYEKIRRAAAAIDALPQAWRDFEWVHVISGQEAARLLPSVKISDLLEAWRTIDRRARIIQHHSIAREELSVREHMVMIMRRMQDVPGYLQFESLLPDKPSTAIYVVSFLSILELARENMLLLTQSEAMAPLYLHRASS